MAHLLLFVEPEGPHLNWQSLSIAEPEPEDLPLSVMIPGVSTAMSVLQRVLPEIASTDIPILIVGESGTGKDVIAAEIHRLSPQCRQSFIKFSCSGMSLDSLLSARAGDTKHDSELPRTGTILLDEVGGLNLDQQTNLLTLLPDNGSRGSNGLSSRLISTSAKDLNHEMRNGAFREELYFRLNGFCLRMPSLRQRKEDIPFLFAAFVDKYAKLFGRERPKIKDSTVNLLMQHSWPGNIRELENAARAVVLLGDDQFAIDDLTPHSESKTAEENSKTPATDSLSLKQAAREASRKAERKMILESLERTHWNRKRSARELQISYKALLYKLKQLGLGDKTRSEV